MDLLQASKTRLDAAIKFRDVIVASKARFIQQVLDIARRETTNAAKLAEFERTLRVRFDTEILPAMLKDMAAQMGDVYDGLSPEQTVQKCEREHQQLLLRLHSPPPQPQPQPTPERILNDAFYHPQPIVAERSCNDYYQSAIYQPLNTPATSHSSSCSCCTIL